VGSTSHLQNTLLQTIRALASTIKIHISSQKIGCKALQKLNQESSKSRNSHDILLLRSLNHYTIQGEDNNIKY
jgi:hypothetical protein